MPRKRASIGKGEMGNMDSKILEISKNVLMISTFVPNTGLSINVFLIKGEKPALIDAGSAATIDAILTKLKELIDPREINTSLLRMNILTILVA